MKRRLDGVVRFACLGITGTLLLSMFATVKVYAANTMNLDATLVQSACTITFTGAVTADGGNLTIPTQESADFSSGTILGATNATAVRLTLSGCGAGAGTAAPTIVLTGNAWPNAVSGASQGFLFKDYSALNPTAGGTSDGYFIVVGKQANPTFGTTATGVWGAGVNKNDIIYSGTAGGGGNAGTVTVYPGVVCVSGSCPTAKAGSLKATLVFEFRYA